jgi:uncharacterized protein (TIGR01777 family)
MVIGITGATGFIGRHVLRAAGTAGHEVVAFTRKAGVFLPEARQVREWRAGSVPDLGGCEAVIHLAGEPVLGRWTPEKRAAIRDSRVDGTRRVVAGLEACRPRPAVLVSASAIGIYGNRGDEELGESSAPGTGFLAEVTAAWEAEAASGLALGVRVVSGRIGVVLGPDGGAWPLLRRVFGLGAGGRLGAGRQWMSWVHVRDVAGLLVAAATDVRYEGAVNVVSPGPVTNVDFTRAVARALRRPALFPVPAVALRTVLRDQAGLFLDSQRVVPRAAQSLGYGFTFPDLEEALRDLAGG